MHKDFFVHIIRHKSDLFRSILAFNELDAGRSEEPPSLLTEIPGIDAAALWANQRVRRRLTQGSDTEAGFWDFTEESRRLALLPPDLLTRAVLQFGVAVNADELARLITRDEVRATRQEIGPELFAYALQRGRYQAGSLTRLFSDRDGTLAERIGLHGRYALALCCSVWPSELLELCAARFHELTGVFAPDDSTAKNIAQAFDDVAQTEIRRFVWFGFKKILLKEVAPQWAPCFD